MTKCIPCAGFGVINDGPEPGPGRTCGVCGGSGLALMIVEYNPDPLRSWTWERLRDFFAGGGEIRAPSAEELIEDCRDPLGLSKLEAEGVNEFRLLFEDLDPDGFKGLRHRYKLPEVKWHPIGTEADRVLARIREALENDIPMEMGVDLARGQSETWQISWDPEAGKMVYRKLSPADMVRRDLAGEGSPDNGSD